MTDQAYHEKRMSIYFACYCYSFHYHKGLGSRSYRLGCTCTRSGHLHPGLYAESETRLCEEDPVAAAFLDHLIAIDY